MISSLMVSWRCSGSSEAAATVVAPVVPVFVGPVSGTEDPGTTDGFEAEEELVSEDLMKEAPCEGWNSSSLLSCVRALERW